MTLTLTLPLGEHIYTGRQVTFEAPCESEGLTGLIVEGVTYGLVDAYGDTLVSDSFEVGALVSVIFHVEKQMAFVQNAVTSAFIERTKAPMYSYGTEDLTAGVSPLETGKIYLVYE